MPTTVFTPVEYSSVGLSEEAALEKYGEDNIEVTNFKYFTTIMMQNHLGDASGWERLEVNIL